MHKYQHLQNRIESLVLEDSIPSLTGGRQEGLLLLVGLMVLI